MVYRGTYRGGVVILEGDTALPEGQVVEVVVQEKLMAESPVSAWQELRKLSGSAPSGHQDAARNHDHYLFGAPKREPEI